MPPLWFGLASLCAVLSALEGVWIKRLALRGFGRPFLVLTAVSFATPVLWLAVLRDPPTSVSPSFWLPFAMSTALNCAALWLYFAAFAAGDVSVVMPLLALTPAWMLLSTRAITGEFPSPRGLVGIALVTAGCYGLGLEGGGALEPLRRLWRGRGSRYALLTGLMWSLTSNFDKAAVEASSRYFHPALSGVFLCAFFGAWSWRLCRRDFGRLRAGRERAELGALGAIVSGLLLSQFAAVDLAQATYVIAVKRAGLALGVLLGWKIYGEPYGRRRLAMSGIVLAGLAFLA